MSKIRWNRYVHRTLAYLFVLSIFRTRTTPNMITLSTVVIGLVAGCAFVWGTPIAMFVGGACLWAAAILDGADGILARAKGLQSEFGRALDGAADALVAVFTVFPAFYHIWVTYHNPYHLVLMVPALTSAEPNQASPWGRRSYRSVRTKWLWPGAEKHSCDNYHASRRISCYRVCLPWCCSRSYGGPGAS